MPTAILITGATDGIGLELARRYRSRCEVLILVGRRPLSELKEELFQHARYIQVDLAHPDAADIVARSLKQWNIDSLDLLIQNAGTGYYGPCERQPAESIDQIVDVNLWTPIALTHALAAQILAAHGKVVFISSIASSLPCPSYAVYGASKAALDGFARSLRIEWSGRASVQVIHPGATATGIHKKVGMPDDRVHSFASVADVSDGIVAAIARGRRSVVIGKKNRILVLIGRHLRGPLDAFLRWRSRCVR